MMTYRIALALFIFGFVAASINEAALYSAKIPESGITITESQATAVAEQAQNESLNPFTMLSLMMKFGRVILMAFLAVLTILPLLVNGFGIPVWIAMIFQGPIWLVYIVDVADWYRGTRTGW